MMRLLLVALLMTVPAAALADGTLPPTAPALEGNRVDLTHDVLTWTASSYGGTVLSYRVQREAADASWSEVVSVSASTFTVTLTDAASLTAIALQVCPETAAWGVGPEPGYLAGYGCSNSVNPHDGLTI